MITPFVIGHRGYPQKAPENTLASFALAFRSGAGMVECDVTLTQDKEVVVIHDDALNRTTNGKGSVSSHSLSELSKLDAGSWFSSDFQGERIPTLGELLALVRGKGLVNIEIKPEAVTQDESTGGIEAKVIAAVQNMGMESSVLISSFDARAVKRTKALAPGIEAAFLIHEKMHPSPDRIRQDLGCESIHFNAKKNGPVEIQSVLDAGMRVRLYTVNNATEARQLRAWGASGIFTDRVEEMLSAFNPTN